MTHSPQTARPSFADAIGTEHRAAGDSVRIVSLVPSVTELLIDLGLGTALVGRTGFCVHPREALRDVAKVGGTKDIRLDRLRTLDATHVIVNIDENRRETVEEIARFVPNVVVTHPCAPADNLALYRLLGGIFDRREEAEALCEELEQALVAASELRAELPTESVLYLIWREPWMSISPATYISATLSAVGWQSWPHAQSPRYPELRPQDAAAAGVKRVLLSSEPYRFRASHIAELETICALPAMLIDATMTSWYGSRAPRGLRHLIGLRRALASAGDPG